MRIRTKLIAFILGIIFVLASVFAFIARDLFRLADLAGQEEGVRLKAKNSLAQLVQLSQVSLAINDRDELRKLVETYADDRDFVGAVVTGADGGKIVTVGDATAVEGRSRSGQAAGVRELENGNVVATAAVLLEGVSIGAVSIAYTLSRIRGAQARVVVLGVVLLLLLAGGVVVSIWFSGRLTDVLNQTAQELKAAAAEISAVATQTESNVENEASSVEETRRTMEAMLQAASEISEGALAMVDIAAHSSEASRVIGERITKLNGQATRITKISETIRGIATKSDILALNAALEGTKAGDAGRGFVLVGVEMRRLAETVMEAMRQIEDLATDIRDLSQSAALASEEGQKLSYETREKSERITVITNQQRSATEQVKVSMDDLQQFTSMALSGAKEAKATAEDLVRTSVGLTVLLEGTANGHADPAVRRHRQTAKSTVSEHVKT